MMTCVEAVANDREVKAFRRDMKPIRHHLYRGLELSRIALVEVRPRDLTVDDVMGYGKRDLVRQHIDLLRQYDRNPAFDFMLSAYWKRLQRIYKADGVADVVLIARVQRFICLFEDMKQRGFDPQYPVTVADLAHLVDTGRLGYRYLRIAGAHRTAAAKVLGLPRIPARVFEPDIVPSRAVQSGNL